ncbi:hypothetical protein BCR36DRAFT_584677 [Piromyces finnis]|uniref:Inositol-pentakisphosphate 2-kinase n=1 Tax=Piromyces finnis TaxID=1754191 RepID=A0A1Y1V586_9FUNG|nr:hypothetical protein BCR36DRAFT_584677 [Piromyces finnis]|eukprot:ORX47580.1 hypothetical protein BCR36DRAFT_584677 [Piromyces finnis]
MINEINEIVNNIKIADLPELLHEKLWEYKAEGRANLVVTYCGNNVEYNGIILRLRKITLEEYKIQQLKNQSIKSKDEITANKETKINDSVDNNSINTEDINTNDTNNKIYNLIDKLQINNILYNNLIINNLLGERFSGTNILLKVNSSFLENLNQYIYSYRPENRRSVDRIDNEQYYGILSLDYTKVKKNQTVILSSKETKSLDLNALNIFNSEFLNKIKIQKDFVNSNNLNNQIKLDEFTEQEKDVSKSIYQQCSSTVISNLNTPSNDSSILNIKDHNHSLLNDSNNQSIPETHTIAIELKPKWGFKPNPLKSAFTKKESLIKYKYCRFCLHYLYKNKDKIEGNPPINTNEIHPILKKHFCPLDLYSKDNERINKSINSLFNCPGNNLKLFINGKQVNLKSLNKKDESKRKEDKKSQNNKKIKIDTNDNDDTKDNKKCNKDKDNMNNEDLIENLTKFFNCNKENLKQEFCNFFTYLILQESELFDRLKFHQRNLDSLDIEKIIQFYEYFIHKDYQSEDSSVNRKEMKEPTMEDWFIGFNNYKNKTRSLPLASKYTNLTHSGKELLKNDIYKKDNMLKKEKIFTDEEKKQHILEFLISKTIKDCSILIAVQSINDDDNNCKDGSLNKKLSSSIINQSNKITENNAQASDLNFEKENYREIKIKSKKYQYNIHVVDLDSKNQDIVECYHSYKKCFGDCRENECID